MPTLFDLALTESGDVTYDDGGDLATVIDEDALKQQVAIDAANVSAQREGGRLDKVAAKDFRADLEDRIRKRGYSSLVSFRVSDIDVPNETVVMEGTISGETSWRFDIEI